MANKSTESTISYFRVIVGIIAVSCVGLVFVKREVDLDETARRIRSLEKEISILQMKTAEAKIELEALTAYPRISEAAKQYGLYITTRKPTMISLNINDMPAEMRQDFEPLRSDKQQVTSDK